MSVIYELTKTATLSTLGDATVYSSGHINGFISDIYVSISKGAGAGDSVTIQSSDGTRTILKVANPSTLGMLYHPRGIAVNSTGSVLASTSVPVGINFAAYVPFTLHKEKFAVVAACSSGLGGGTVTVKVRWY